MLENPMEWLKGFHLGFLGHYERTGELDWAKYNRPHNQLPPSGPGIDLSQSRLMLISTAGAYLKDHQKAFDANNPLGDYSMRRIPIDAAFEDLAIAHDHYDKQYIQTDPQVLLPLGHLQDMVNEGLIGEIAPVFVSFSGYQPNVIRVVKELAPAILRTAKEFDVQAALLVPS